MPRNKKRRRGERGPDGAPNKSRPGDGKREGTPHDYERKVSFECPVCGGRLDFDRRDDRWFCNCFTCSAAGLTGSPYLRALSDATDVPAYKILYGPHELPLPVRGGRRSLAEPESLPTDASITGWQDALLSERSALRYLRRERGLTLDVIERMRIGYGRVGGRPPAFTLPVFDAGRKLVNVRERYWPDPLRASGGKEVKMRGLRRRGSQLYPSVPRGGTLLLCAGELDALLGRQHGLAAISTTCGASLPVHLAERLTGRRIVVLFDVGEEGAARGAVARLRDADVRARSVALDLPRRGDDLTDWFMTYGRSADELRDLLGMPRRGGGS